MVGKKIPKKEWVVLEHFILNESKKIEETLKKYNKITSENIDHFSTYPGKIESDSNDISRVTAGKACKRFFKMSILESPTRDYTHKRGPKSKFYSLKTDLPTIRKLVKLILEFYPYSEAKKLLDNYYFTYNLNESLIREVLCEKGVSISRLISAMDLDINDAQHIKGLLERNIGNEVSSQDEKGISSLVKESVEKYEINNKRTESNYLETLKSFCDHFYKELSSPNNDGTKYYFRDFDRYSISRSTCCDYGKYSNLLALTSVDSIFPFNLKLPVFNEKFSETKKIEKIKELNIITFYERCYGILPEYVIDFLDYLNKTIRSIISWLENFENNFPFYSQKELDSFHKLIKTLTDFSIQFYDKFFKCYALFNFDELKKDIDELYKQLIEYLSYIKGKKIGTEEREIENIIDKEINNVDLQFQKVRKHLNECKNIKELTNEYIQSNFNSVLQEHYSIFEYEKLILPILVLIQSSPLALNEFLNGDWDSFDLSFDFFISGQQNIRNSKFLTKLIHIAFIDLMCMPNIFFEKGIVESISFNSFCPSGVNHFGVIEADDRRKLTEYINNSFDECYNEISYDQLRDINVTPLKIKLKHFYELNFYLSFTMNTIGSNQKISSSLSIDIIQEIEYYFFKIRELKDVNSLISKLQKTDKSIYNHIRKLLSNKMQDIILHYDTSLQPSIRLKQELLKELNLVILKPELLYHRGVFNKLVKGNDNLKELIERISTIDISFKDLIQVVYDPSSNNLSTEIVISNKRILQKVFEDEFELSGSY